jgi:hypothetical protein
VVNSQPHFVKIFLKTSTFQTIGKVPSFLTTCPPESVGGLLDEIFVLTEDGTGQGEGGRRRNGVDHLQSNNQSNQ